MTSQLDDHKLTKKLRYAQKTLNEPNGVITLIIV